MSAADDRLADLLKEVLDRLDSIDRNLQELNESSSMHNDTRQMALKHDRALSLVFERIGKLETGRDA